jgi:hypothetical protein
MSLTKVNAADRRHRDRAECEVRDCHAAFDLSLGRNFRNKIGAAACEAPPRTR